MNETRRSFLKQSVAATSTGLILPDWLADFAYGNTLRTKSNNDRLKLGSIGVGAVSYTHLTLPTSDLV